MKKNKGEGTQGEKEIRIRKIRKPRKKKKNEKGK